MNHIKPLLRVLALLLPVTLAVQACSTVTPVESGNQVSTSPTPTESSAQPSSAGATQAGPTDTAERPSVDEVLADLDLASFDGLVMVRQGDDIVTRGFGQADRDTGAGFDDQTVITVGSITKQFTAAAILKLEMEGKLSVDDRLGDHLPDATGELADVTLHQLLTHTAGLPGGLGHDFAPISRTEMIELTASAVDTPGEAYSYSNPGYSMLGAVIEEVTGGSYEEYLQSALFGPAGMTATGYQLADWSDHVQAVGYDGDERWGRVTEMPWADDGPYWHLRANGGIHSTGADMMRWDEALNGNQILDEAAKEKLFGRHVSESPDGGDWYYAYGWLKVALPDGKTLITHNGGNGIFFADMLRFVDDDVTIFIASNTSGADEDLAFRIADALLGTSLTPPSTGCIVDDPTVYPTIDDFPDTEAGQTVAALWHAFTDADAAEVEAFVTTRSPEDMAQQMSPDELAAQVMAIQQELAYHELIEIRSADDLTFYLVLDGRDVPQIVVSAQADAQDPAVLGCIDIGHFED